MDDSEKIEVKKTSSAPPVPKELLSARPAMTKVVPRNPDDVVAEASEATNDPEAPQESPEHIEQDRQERIEYLKNIRKPAKKSKEPKGKKWLVVVIAILVLVLAGLAGAYWFLHQPTADSQLSKTKTSNTNSSPATVSEEPTDLKDYDSSNFSLSMKYSASWTVSDTTDTLTITSPVLQLTEGAGQSKDGKVLLTVHHQQPSLVEFKSGNAVAVLDSKNVSYSAPATGQRGSTYLSYLQYHSTTAKGALDAIYITGNAGYKKTQNVPQTDVVKVDPLVTISFMSCTGTDCKATQPLNVSADKFVSSQTYETVETMLRSLAFN